MATERSWAQALPTLLWLLAAAFAVGVLIALA
jgi:hypothetical protein